MNYSNIYSVERLRDFISVVEGKIKQKWTEIDKMRLQLNKLSQDTALEEHNHLINTMDATEYELNSLYQELNALYKRYWHITSAQYFKKNDYDD